MSWSAAVLPALVSALVYMLPGIMVALAAGFRMGRAILVAPTLSVGTVAGLAVVLGKVGVRFSIWTELIGTLLLTAAVLALRLLITRPQHRRVDHHHGTSPGRLRVWAAPFMGLVINAVTVWWTFIDVLSGPDAIIQAYDTPFHFSVIRYLMVTSNGSSIGAALVDRTVGSSFYPAGWHDTVALVAQTTDAWLPVAVNANVILILTLVWPLSVMALTRAILPGHPWALLGAGAAAGLFGAFPMRFAIWGLLYSNLLSWAILPGAMAIFIWMWQRRPLTSSLLLFAIAFTGVALCQPNGVFTAAVLLMPFLLAQSWRMCRGKRLGAVRAILVDVVLVTGVAALWHKIYNAPFMHRTVIFDWPAHTNVEGAFRELVTGSTNNMRLSPVISAATAIAVATWVILWARRRDRSLWPVVALLGTGVLYVLGAGVPSESAVPGRLHFMRDLLTGFWYHDQYRLAAIPVLVAVPLVGALIAAVAEGSSRHRFVSGCAAALVLSLILVPTLVTSEFSVRRANIERDSSLNGTQPLTPTELNFLQQVTRYVPTGEPVLNNPYDGSAYAYGLMNLNTVYRSYEANWIGHATKDQDDLHQVTNDAAAKPDLVCPLLERNDVRYVLVMPKNATSYSGQDGVRYSVSWWKGLEISSSTPGFVPVLTDGKGDVLYEVAACS